MRALIVVEVDDAWMARRVDESWAEYGGDLPGPKPSPLDYFLGRLRDVAADELPLALFSWPAEITVELAPEDA